MAAAQMASATMRRSQSDATMGRSGTYGGTLGGTGSKDFTATGGKGLGTTGGKSLTGSTGVYSGAQTLGGYTSRPGGVYTSEATGELRKLVKTASLPNLQPRLPNKKEAPHFQAASYSRYMRCNGTTVSMDSLKKFMFPSRLENPNTTGRLELFCRYGPADEDGNLRGGQGGSHVHSDGDINVMVKQDCREGLFRQFNRPKSDVEEIVNSLLPAAMSGRYSEKEVEAMLAKVPRDEEGRMNFAVMQNLVLEKMDQRLKAIVKRVESGKPIVPPKERPIAVGFQSEPNAIRMSITTKKKYTNDSEAIVATERRLNSYAGLIAPVEQQQMAQQLAANVVLVRGPGDVTERWDRYCALRRTGRSSYVRARNSERYNPALDEGLTNKHPGVSSLLAASAAGTSAAAQLAA
eukprot:TRINITY_DN80398_c0_g1_i1.p2 TRINITY_DN80398_c0_g1~~TRINITY_DN80398_c0_g1_i1.p2  ORF type:complete len:406 (+),score=98.49 TRINITY_DN80398_c0_g1_i1:145-1362(+)